MAHVISKQGWNKSKLPFELNYLPVASICFYLVPDIHDWLISNENNEIVQQCKLTNLCFSDK